MATAAIRIMTAAVATWYGLTPWGSHPLVLRRYVVVQLLVVVDERPEVDARSEVGVKGVRLHEGLPLRGVVDLLEHVDPERLLRRRQAGRRHDRPHDEVVVDREALRLAGREARVRSGGRACRRERAERTELLLLIETQPFARVVHRDLDAALMAGEGGRHRSTAGLRHVARDLDAGDLGDAEEHDLVLLLRSGPGRDELL